MDNGASSYHRFIEGDKAAFEQLIETYSANIIFFINGIVRSLPAAEDLMEDTFLEIYIRKPNFKETALFKTYLFKIARNKALNYIKKNNRISDVPFEETDLCELQSVEERILTKERQKQVNSALHQLSDDYRTAIHLIYFEDMSYAAAAVVMKKNKKQIDNLIYRAKQQLKTALEKEGFSYEEQ